MKNKNHIVISRYNEEVSWVKTLDQSKLNIFIYNKGDIIENQFSSGVSIIDLQNIGREAHTYLYHILKNYENLPDKIIFTQAHPDDHVTSDFTQRISRFIDSESEFEYFSKDLLEMRLSGDFVEESGNLNGIFWHNKHTLESPCVTIPSSIIPDIYSREWVFGPGAIFGVSKNSIRKNSKEFYRGSIEILEKSTDPIYSIEAHAFERSWYLIFNK